MPIEILTKQDLLEFKADLINEMKGILSASSTTDTSNIAIAEVLLSAEVKSILQCSTGKLEALRKSGKLPFSKVLGTIYYKRSDIQALLNNGI